MENRIKEKELEEKALLTFLQRTKEGEYATIAECPLAFIREKEQREPIYNDEEYYYSIR
ncbi:MAG: hypothetical protein HY892_07490 [Deltaproteobacteria bacterium]|nr:hypothetical protein [Deltaproteobacteria bacterium]